MNTTENQMSDSCDSDFVATIRDWRNWPFYWTGNWRTWPFVHYWWKRHVTRQWRKSKCKSEAL